MTALLQFYHRHRSIILCYVATVLLLVAVSIYRPGFGLGDVGALRSLAREAAVIGLISLGQTFVIMTGGIDLSLPWVLTGSAVIMTMLTQGNDAALIWAVPLVLGMALLIGWINGMVITKFEVSPVIVTLSMNGILTGAISGWRAARGDTGTIRRGSAFVVELARGRMFEVPNLVWMLIALTTAASVVLSLTAFGRRIMHQHKSESRLFGHQRLDDSTGLHARRIVRGRGRHPADRKAGNAYLDGRPVSVHFGRDVAIGSASVLGGTGPR